MASTTVSAAASLLNMVSNYGRVNEILRMPASCHKTLHQCTMPPKWEINDEVKTKNCCCSIGEPMHLVQ